MVTDAGVSDAVVPWLGIVAVALVVLAAPALLVLRARPALLAGSLAAIFLVPTAISRGTDVHIARERTFFGALPDCRARRHAFLLSRDHAAWRPMEA